VFVTKNQKLSAELEQVKLELKLERQNKFATNQQKQADATPDPEPEKPKGKRGAPVGHPGWFRPIPTHHDWAVDVPAPRQCPHCQGPVDVLSGTESSHHLQEDIIDGVYRVVLYRHAACRGGQCDRLVEQPGKNEILLSRIGSFPRSKAAYLRNVIGIIGFETKLAERALRPLVVLRKITFGHRSETGASTMAKLMTVAETARRHGHRASDIYFELLTRPPDQVMKRLYADASTPAN